MNLRDRRLSFLVRAGLVPRAPSAWQLRAGWLAMLPVTLGESERERARSRRTLLGQVPVRVPLQVLFSPRQLWVDTGLGLSNEAVVRHLLCVYHEDAFLGFDLQLLQSLPGGLALLRTEARRVTGRGLRTRLLEGMTGGHGYHERLPRLAEEAEAFRYPDPLDLDPRFASVVGFVRWCAGLPDWPGRAFYGFE